MPTDVPPEVQVVGAVACAKTLKVIAALAAPVIPDSVAVIVEAEIGAPATAVEGAAIPIGFGSVSVNVELRLAGYVLRSGTVGGTGSEVAPPEVAVAVYWMPETNPVGTVYEPPENVYVLVPRDDVSVTVVDPANGAPERLTWNEIVAGR